jgi:hypothetical protein
MTDQHVPYKAHPAHWEFVIKRTQGPGDDYLASVLRELMERIEALEAAQLEQAESNRFCTDGITLAKLATSALTSAERAELGVVTCVQLEAAMLRSTSDARQAAMPELRAASAEAQPAGGLVERVARSIERTVLHDFNLDSCAPEARAAIREVAVHVRKRNPFFELDTPIESDVWEAVAELLEREADQ